LLAVGESGGEDGAPRGSLKITSGKEGIEAVEIELRAVARERGLSWFERCADETSEVPLDRSVAGVFKIRPDEAFAGLERFFLCTSPCKGCSGKSSASISPEITANPRRSIAISAGSVVFHDSSLFQEATSSSNCGISAHGLKGRSAPG